MVGLKLGMAVLQLGSDGQLATALAKVIGISGETSVVVESDGDADRMTRAAASAGLLIDVKTTRLRTCRLPRIDSMWSSWPTCSATCG